MFLAAWSDGMPSLVASSNPIEVGAVLDAQLYWGDLHAQSSIGCGSRSIDAYFAHARDFAAMNEAYRAALPEPFPARTTVEAGLVAPDGLVEIMMTAVK